MPLIKIHTNLPVAPDQQQRLLSDVSKTVSKLLGKPERYVMVALEAEQPMLFAGSDEPLAYLELKSIGLPADNTNALSNSLCRFLSATLGISTDRIYIEFANAERHMWGWNNGTF